MKTFTDVGTTFSYMALYYVVIASLNIVIRASLIYRGIDMIID